MPSIYHVFDNRNPSRFDQHRDHPEPNPEIPLFLRRPFMKESKMLPSSGVENLRTYVKHHYTSKSVGSLPRRLPMSMPHSEDSSSTRQTFSHMRLGRRAQDYDA